MILPIYLSIVYVSKAKQLFLFIKMIGPIPLHQLSPLNSIHYFNCI